MRTNVYLTVDTEHSMGGAWANSALRPVPTARHIYCRIGGLDHGIGWLCDELDRQRLHATFFAEMFGSLVFGKDDTRAWCQYLLERGQDVQLHTHLNFYYYAKQQSSTNLTTHTDDLASLPSPLRRELLELACELFHYAVGHSPMAFRAGNWRANRTLISDLPAMGIFLDSSFNPAARAGGSFPNEGLKVNTLQSIGRVWELPLSIVRQDLPEPHLVDGLRPLDLVSLSAWEIQKALEEFYNSGTAHIVAVLHSFSGVKTRDIQYRRLRPDRVVRGRVRFLLEYLATNRDRFRVSTFSELASELDQAQQCDHCVVPNLGFIHPVARKLVQAVNSLYWI